MAGPVPVYKKEYQIGLGDIDFQKKLKISALFNFFQDIASLHAENLGIGIDSLISGYGVTWVLTDTGGYGKNARAGKNIIIETWPIRPGSWSLAGFPGA